MISDECLRDIATHVAHRDRVIVICRTNREARAGLEALDRVMWDKGMLIPHKLTRECNELSTRGCWARFVSARGRGLRGLSADMVLIDGPETVPNDAIPIVHAGAELQWAT